MDAPITRRDFLNAALIGSGALLLDLPAPRFLFAEENPWNGYGGEGQYGGRNGNTQTVVKAAHGIRDGAYESMLASADDTGEIYDLVVVGAGISGLGAAHRFLKTAPAGARCIILDNHGIFGGEAKRNRFEVDGFTLFGPQGANSFAVPSNSSQPGYDIYRKLGMPRSFDYTDPAPEVKNLWFDHTNFGFMLWYDAPSVGHLFEGQEPGAAQWVKDFWRTGLDSAPYAKTVRDDFARWRRGPDRPGSGDDFHRRLDTMSYKKYLELELGLDPTLTRYADPIAAASLGLGCDAISAYAAYEIGMPGFYPFKVRGRVAGEPPWHSFPGGIDGIPRYFLKALIPGSIPRGTDFPEVYLAPVDFAALDRKENPVSLRLSATVVGVEHLGSADSADHVRITYATDGKLVSLRARAVVLTGGSWVTRRIVRDLPSSIRTAYRTFVRAPMLVANVALKNWRFLQRLGLTACRWHGGFGFSCNIRQPMIVGDLRQPLDPDKPAVLTFYIPFPAPGATPAEQASRGRGELLSTSYRDYEIKIREQMVRLFGAGGFDPGKDIAGIVLNRWGHAYVVPQPGFHFGPSGLPAPRDIVRRGFGRVAFGNAELNGHQHWVAAVEEGARATDQVLSRL